MFPARRGLEPVAFGHDDDDDDDDDVGVRVLVCDWVRRYPQHQCAYLRLYFL